MRKLNLLNSYEVTIEKVSGDARTREKLTYECFCEADAKVWGQGKLRGLSSGRVVDIRKLQKA